MSRLGRTTQAPRKPNDITVERPADKIVQAIDKVAAICADQLTESLVVRNGRALETRCLEQLIGQITESANVEVLSPSGAEP